MATVSTPSSTPVGTVCALEDAEPEDVEEPDAAGAAEPELPQAAREAVMARAIARARNFFIRILPFS
ncbi:hypothetical protein SDC9_147694 [bioreactor metagenome]|uniref:Uncharacterized protein n=1 Tax=bioreactor metagenome TaxID=1076179 RepID=A0A645EH70_9ZZZZ